MEDIPKPIQVNEEHAYAFHHKIEVEDDPLALETAIKVEVKEEPMDDIAFVSTGDIKIEGVDESLNYTKETVETGFRNLHDISVAALKDDTNPIVSIRSVQEMCDQYDEYLDYKGSHIIQSGGSEKSNVQLKSKLKKLTVQNNQLLKDLAQCKSAQKLLISSLKQQQSRNDKTVRLLQSECERAKTDERHHIDKILVKSALTLKDKMEDFFSTLRKMVKSQEAENSKLNDRIKILHNKLSNLTINISHLIRKADNERFSSVTIEKESLKMTAENKVLLESNKRNKTHLDAVTRRLKLYEYQFKTLKEELKIRSNALASWKRTLGLQMSKSKQQDNVIRMHRTKLDEETRRKEDERKMHHKFYAAYKRVAMKLQTANKEIEMLKKKVDVECAKPCEYCGL